MSKVREFFGDIREMNKKYRCVPLIIFAVIYIASPIDLISEFLHKSWIFYLDDMAVLILVCIATYMEVFLSEKNHNNNERVKSIYPTVHRNTVELDHRRNISSAGSISDDDIYGISDTQSYGVEFNESDEKSSEPEESFEAEQFIFNSIGDEQSDDRNESCFFEQKIIADVSATDDCLRKVSEQSRPEGFIIGDGSTIIW